MFQSIYLPPPALADYLDCVWYYDCAVPPQRLERVLPDGCLQLIVHLRGEPLRVFERDGTLRLVSGPLVCGPRARYSLTDAGQHGALMGVHFRPGGAAALLGLPASELLDTDVALEELWGPAASELQERIVMARTPEARRGLLSATLRAHIPLVASPHPAVTHAVRTLANVRSGGSVAAVAEGAGLSHRHFIHLFREAVGLAPKTYQRVRRFQLALRAIARGERVEWAALAALIGYYDQAHLAHDFQAFAGMAPTHYLARRGEHHNHVPTGA